jgi:tetratricopeptide (TPR) repeat protein
MLLPCLRKALLVCFVWSTAALGAAHSPFLWNIPPEKGTFWSRKADLLSLKEKIHQGPVVVTGLSGVGKSTLVHAFARQHHKKYRLVWMFDASKGVNNQMIDFANKLYTHQNPGKKGTFEKKEEASFYVKNLLRTAAFSWLLIFDGAQALASVEDEFPETHGQQDKHVVVTATSAHGVSPQNLLEMIPYTPEDALGFLKSKVTGEEADLSFLSETLGYHPMALTQAVAYLGVTPGMTAREYAAQFLGHKDAFWSSEKKALGGQTLLHTSLKMSLDRLQKDDPAAFLSLCFFAMSDTTCLDLSHIKRWYEGTAGGDLAGFGPLRESAFLTDGAPLDGDVTYTLHGYLRDVILHDTPQEVKTKAATVGVSLYKDTFPEKIEDCLKTFEAAPRLAPHLKALMAQLDLMPADTAFPTALRLFYYADTVARDDVFANSFSQKLKGMIDSGLSLDPYHAGVFYSWYGDAIISTNGLDAAIKELQTADVFFKKADSQKARYERVMLLANNLGFFLHWKGQIEEAEACLKEAKRLQEGHEEIFPQSAIYELDAALAMDQGRPQDAIPVLDTELELLEKDSTLKKAVGHFVKSLKACALLKLAALKEGDRLPQEALLLRKQAHALSLDAYDHAVKSSDGDENAEVVARTLLYLSQSESTLGDFQKAEEHARKAITIFDKEYGGTHNVPRQGVAHMALGDALMGQGRYQEAFDAYTRAEEIFDTIAPTHQKYDDLSELYEKIVTVGIALKDGNITDPYDKKHLYVFGPTHPRYYMLSRKRIDAEL